MGKTADLTVVQLIDLSVCVEWMYTLYKFHFLNGISEINQLFDDILIIWPAPVYIYTYMVQTLFSYEDFMTALQWLSKYTA